MIYCSVVISDYYDNTVPHCSYNSVIYSTMIHFASGRNNHPNFCLLQSCHTEKFHSGLIPARLNHAQSLLSSVISINDKSSSSCSVLFCIVTYSVLATPGLDGITIQEPKRVKAYSSHKDWDAVGRYVVRRGGRKTGRGRGPVQSLVS